MWSTERDIWDFSQRIKTGVFACFKFGKFVLSLVALVWFSGCKSGPEDSSKLGVYQVNERQTAFYRYGPAQSFGPDFNIPMGNRVVVLKYESAFSRVMTEDGISGYVATDAIKPAPPPPPQKKLAASISSIRSSRSTRSSTKRGGPSSANSAVMESGPLFEPDLPVLPDETAVKPEKH